MKIRMMGFLIFLSIFLLIYGGVHYYVFMRLVGDAKISGVYYNILTGAFLFLFLSFPLFHFAFRHFRSPLINIANYGASIWMGIITYLFLITLAFELISFILFLISQPIKFDLTKVLPNPAQKAVIISILTGLICIYGAIEAAVIRVKDITITIPDLAPGKNGFKIAQISDLHLGVIVNGRRLERIVKKVNGLDPDVIVITGDLLDEQAFQINGIKKPICNLRSKHGVYAVTGNHEFFAGIDKSAAFMKEACIELLRNKWVNIDGDIQLVGRDDPAAKFMGENHIPPLNEILTGIDKTKPIIYLYHTPLTKLEELTENGIDLQLSGHTHKGQIWPFGYITKLVYKTAYGLFTNGKSYIYVSNGTGTWGPPMRVGARPEVTLIKLFSD